MLPVLPQKTLRQMQDEIGAWGDATFPTSNPGTIAAHLREEANELHAEFMTMVYGSTDDHAECADIAILAIQYAHRRGFDLTEAIEAKMAVNRARVWNTTPEPAGHFKHVEGEARS